MKKKRILLLVCAAVLAAAAACAGIWAWNACHAGSHEDAKNSAVCILREDQLVYTDDQGTQIDAEAVDSYIGAGIAVGSPGKPVSCFVTDACMLPEAQSYPVYRDAQGRFHRERAQAGENPQEYSCEVRSEYYIVFGDMDARQSAALKAADTDLGILLLALDEPTNEREAARLRQIDGEDTFIPVFQIGFDKNFCDVCNPEQGFYVKDMYTEYGILFRIQAPAETGTGEILQYDVRGTSMIWGAPLADERGRVIGMGRMKENSSEPCAALSSREIIRFLKAQGIG